MIATLSTLTAETELAIYDDNYALVQETIELSLKEGMNEVEHVGVTTGLDPQSIILRPIGGNADIVAVEQNFHADLVDQDWLLKAYEGETIEFRKLVGDAEVYFDGMIVRAPTRFGNQSQPPIIEVDGKIYTSLPGTPLFPSIGPDRLYEPVVNWQLQSSTAIETAGRLTYLTTGLTYDTVYNILLPSEGDVEMAQLDGVVSIENTTGKNFEDARIRLIAGEIARENKSSALGRSEGFLQRSVRMDSFSASAAQPKRSALGSVYQYEISGIRSLKTGETKQLNLLSSKLVTVEDEYVFEQGNQMRFYGRTNIDPSNGNQESTSLSVYRSFDNTEENGLGNPLPEGLIRFYQNDAEDRVSFVGEGRIEHTPKGESARVYVGKAFDLVGERKVTDFERNAKQRTMQETCEIQIRNRGDAPVSITVIESLYRAENWEIAKHSTAFEKVDGNTIEFELELAPNESQTIHYSVRYEIPEWVSLNFKSY